MTQIYDPLYGFVKLTPVENDIINSPYYQRLRWIRQLGFSHYVFPGAEHTRFIHAIGVMHMAGLMLKQMGLLPEESELTTLKTETAIYAQSVRLAALLHDIGTFPFSHTTEVSYIREGRGRQDREKNLPDSHEHLGSWIIKNTKSARGITGILRRYGLDPAQISRLIKGESDSILANQMLHSDVDADRLDYLARDAYYTGIKYGTIDRDYIIHHATRVDIKGHRVLAFKHNAQHAIEDFLMARFSWYSQILKSPAGAKFDFLAETICRYLLQKKKVWSFNDLKNLAAKFPDRFFSFNDGYFLQAVLEAYLAKETPENMREMAGMLIYRKPPKSLTGGEFSQRLVRKPEERALAVKAMQEKVREIEEYLKKKNKKAWIISDIPAEICFAKPGRKKSSLIGPEPLIIDRDKSITALSERKSSLISDLKNITNFIPNVYVNDIGYEILEKARLIPLR